MTLDELETVLRERRGADPTSSYTARLLGDPELIQRKIMEEAFEVCQELGRAEPDAARTAEEAADVPGPRIPQSSAQHPVAMVRRMEIVREEQETDKDGSEGYAHCQPLVRVVAVHH